MENPARIWSQDFKAEDLQVMDGKHIGKLLDIRITEVGPDYLRGTMPVDERTHQPAGILHGGASVVLAESLGSIASYLVIDTTRFMAVGLEVNANHLRAVRSGTVTATCRPFHLGRTTHIWGIEIVTEDGKPVCISRLTVAIVPLQRS